MVLSTYTLLPSDWYHGHSGLNKVGVRGIAGMLVVHARKGEDVHRSRYSQEIMEANNSTFDQNENSQIECNGVFSV